MFDPNEQPVDNYVNIDGEWIYFDCPEDFDDIHERIRTFREDVTAIREALGR